MVVAGDSGSDWWYGPALTTDWLVNEHEDGCS